MSLVDTCSCGAPLSMLPKDHVCQPGVAINEAEAMASLRSHRAQIEAFKMGSKLLGLSERIARYDPKLSADNRADELALHQAIVSLTGEGLLSPPFEATYLRSLDAALTLVPEGWQRSIYDTEHFVVAELWTTGRNAFVAAATPAIAMCSAALSARAPVDTHPKGGDGLSGSVHG